MKRLLAFVLSLAIVAVAVATPAVACVSAPTLGSQHECCGDRAFTAAPVGSCCFLSQPAGNRAVTESRSLAATDRPADAVVDPQPARFGIADAAARWRGSTSPPGSRPVPIYIQQLSLLI